MPTNPIGNGTANLSINVPAGARSVLGRLAFKNEKSMGQLVRQLIARGLDDLYPEAAGDWQRALNKFAAGVTCLFAGMLVIYASFAGRVEFRRLRGRTAGTRIVRVASRGQFEHLEVA